MNENYIRNILDGVAKGDITSADAMEQLKELPYKSMGFANVDHHRQLRTGFPEVIYSQGKTPEQIRDIFGELAGGNRTVIATRATAVDFAAVQEIGRAHV